MGDTDNETDEGTVSEISSAESKDSDVDGNLPAETDIDQLSAASSSVKGKNIYSFQLFFYFLFILSRYLGTSVSVLLDWFSPFEKC